ncbi:endosome/lysosome-associated apoptosis and autophagy regulator 1 isoform X2 [Hypanus sabinus]|uniref:endosome/lysosome-associated apoptosis and autophagy regulator 1 isoform X2 n=2 Tax=Hypanus sabinus TaxID=79690 RepID=UPI0028C3BA7C|nr:endosome/lysosome-associated apoptosis and autophagy regulator 1 isoform X2 [Hypanus sabinus]
MKILGTQALPSLRRPTITDVEDPTSDRRGSHRDYKSDYYYKYTECDSHGSRWRVPVPHIPGSCIGLPDPVKGTSCSFSCGAGQFLDMKEQLCRKCIAGTYSLGTGIEFNEWDTVPPGFVLSAVAQDAADEYSTGNCTMSKWTPQGDFIASNTDECTAILMYAVNLKQSGMVSFEYLYPDTGIFFEFFVQNDQCQATEDEDKWMKKTERNQWNIHTVNLNRGNNVLYWQTTRFSLGLEMQKPVLIRNIRITGVAYTSECFPCKPGTFNSNIGSSHCDLCPRNTYSPRGATSCVNCSPDEYSEPGSGTCKKRSPCSEKDYFFTHTPCNAEGKTQMMYKWIEPKLCSESMKGAVLLPASGVKKPCKPCNPGFVQVNFTGCQPCPLGSYSDGSDACTKCAVGTEPMLGFEYKWWNSLPKNMNTSCFSGINEDCGVVSGWEVAGDHVHSTVAGADNNYLTLTMTVLGFRPPQSVIINDDNPEVARITFVFEMVCSANCELRFLVGPTAENTWTVEIWNGSKEKQSYTYIIEKRMPLAFVWAFQRTTSFEESRKYSSDVAKIYSINVTNVIGGVASYCRPCALESSSSESCVMCSPGQYIDKEYNKCQPCPPNTYLKAHHQIGKESCIPCGPGTQSNLNHTLCYNDCRFVLQEGEKPLEYDFSKLSHITSFRSEPRFTPKGVRFFRNFNISLCGNQGRKLASCVDNVTFGDIFDDDKGIARPISSYICQSTLVPSDLMGLMSSHPTNLADHLIGVTTQTELDNITAAADLFPKEKDSTLPDIIFYYRSTESTQICKNGRVSTVRLRCNPGSVGSGTISVPKKCQEGTCDGCIFHFLWETAEACPLCSKNDYHEIVGACINGIQKIAYVWWEPKLCKGGVALPVQLVTTCKTLDFFLKIGIISGTITACLLIATTCYFYKKNRKLEYKYSKLMMNTNAKDGELPAVDSCAIMEGEDLEDDLIFMSKKSLFGKIKSFAVKRTPDGFDSVPLKSSSGSADMEM